MFRFSHCLPPRSRINPLRVAGLAGLVGCVLAMGCVKADQIDYARKMTAVIAPGPAENDDIALAFGLDQYRPGYDATLAEAASERDEDRISLSSR